MTDQQKNKMLKARLTKYLTYLGGTKEMLFENEIAFKIKSFHKCIFKYPYNKNAAQLFTPVDGKATANS